MCAAAGHYSCSWVIGSLGCDLREGLGSAEIGALDCSALCGLVFGFEILYGPAWWLCKAIPPTKTM